MLNVLTEKMLNRETFPSFSAIILKAYDVYLKKYYIMDKNDVLSEYNKIPLGHNRTNSAVYSKINFKIEVCSAL